MITNRIRSLLEARAEEPESRFYHPALEAETEKLPPAPSKDPIEKLLKTNDEGVYIDPYDTTASLKFNTTDFQKEFLKHPERQQQAECPLTDNELITLRLVFTSWTGLDGEGPNLFGDDYVYFDAEMMIAELNEVRAFFKNDLNSVFGLTGVLAEINQALFMSDLDPYSEEELMGYAVLLHMDLSFLEEFQENLLVEFNTLAHSDGVSAAELDRQAEINEGRFLTELKMIILDFRIRMVDRFRLWRWREEVLLGRVGDSLDEYPGIEIHHAFETTSQLLASGVDSFFIRAGAAKRENLMEIYSFVDLYHLAGLLAQGVDRDVKFGTAMALEDLADLILLLLDELKLDPWTLLTPLGARVIRNQESTEVLYNLHRFSELDEVQLSLATTQAGIPTNRETQFVSEDGTTTIRKEQKPTYVLLEELAAQYVSPQFYSAVEYHRDWVSAVNSLKTLSDARLLNAEEGEIIFYGVGDGISSYRVYTPRELVNTFIATGRFQDPFSIKEFPENREKWVNFSHQSIQRLLQLVIPRLQKKARTTTRNERRIQLQKDLDDLEATIIQTFDNLTALRTGKNPSLWDPKSRHEALVQGLRSQIDGIREPLSQFLAFLFNLGVQLSDWEESMIPISERAKHYAILENPKWKHVDPETTDALVQEVYKMLIVDVESYLQMVATDDKSYYRHILSLRLVRHYQGAYRFDWDDERATIGGQIRRMLAYADLGLWPQLKTSGNWFMATSHYYGIVLLGQNPADATLDIADGPQIELDFNF